MDPKRDKLAALLDRVDADEDICSVVFTGGIPVPFANTALAFWRRPLQRCRHVACNSISRVACQNRSSRLSPPHDGIRSRVYRGTKRFAMGGGFELALACDIQIALDEDYDLGRSKLMLACWVRAARNVCRG